MSKRLIMILLITFFTITSVTTYFFTQQLESSAIVNGREIQPSRPVKPFQLTDVHGNRFTEADFLGHWTILSFGFTHCPDVCPTTLAYYRDELKLLEEEEDFIQFVFVSVDPERDTPKVLEDYVRAFHPKILGLHGTIPQLKAFASQFGAYFAKENQKGDQYNMAHTPYLFLISPKGLWTALYSQPLGRGKVAMDLTRLIDKDKI